MVWVPVVFTTVYTHKPFAFGQPAREVVFTDREERYGPMLRRERK